MFVSVFLETRSRSGGENPVRIMQGFLGNARSQQGEKMQKTVPRPAVRWGRRVGSRL